MGLPLGVSSSPPRRVATLVAATPHFVVAGTMRYPIVLHVYVPSSASCSSSRDAPGATLAPISAMLCILRQSIPVSLPFDSLAPLHAHVQLVGR